MDELRQEFEDAKTDESELEIILDECDLDEALMAEFNAIAKAFDQLKIDYQTLIRTRHLGG